MLSTQESIPSSNGVLSSAVSPIVSNTTSSNLTPPLIPNEHILLTLMHQFQSLANAMIDNFAYEGNSKVKVTSSSGYTLFSNHHNSGSLQRLHFVNSTLKGYNNASTSISTSIKNVLGEMTIGTYNDKFSSFISDNTQKESDLFQQLEYDVRSIVFSSITLSDQGQVSQGALFTPELTHFGDTQSTFTGTINSIAPNSSHQDTQSYLTNFSLTSLSGHELSLNSASSGNGFEYQFLYLIEAFRKVSKHSPNAVIEAILEWRSQFDCSPPQHILKRIQKSLKKEKKKQQKEMAYIKIFTERKELAVNYIFLFILLNILQLFIQPPLITPLASRLIDFSFKHLIDAFSNNKNPTLNPLQESYEVVDDLYGQVIGILSITHFKYIADRFILEIPGRFSTSQGRHEVVYLIRGMKYLRAKYGDPNTIEFLQKFYFDILSKAKKSEIKNACCDAGQSFLSTLELDANTDDEQFFDTCIKSQLQYCQKLNKKNKHITHSYPFYTTLLCLCPRKTFLELMWPHVDSLFKLYQKGDIKMKVLSLDCLLHMFGNYLRLIFPPQERSDSDISTEQQQKEKLEKSTCIERVKKLSNVISVQHKKSAINVDQYEILYNAIVDLIVMIASANIQMGIDFILELINSDYVYSESTYVGLRALLNILDQSQLRSIMTNSQLSTVLYLDPKPLWLEDLLHRNQLFSGSVNGHPTKETISELRHTPHGSDTIRMQSQFTNYYSSGRSNSIKISLRNRYNEEFSVIDDIMRFQEGLGKALSTILKHCENNTHIKGHEEIFVLALTLIPKLIPCDYTSDSIATLVSSCLNHSSEIIRYHSILVIQQLMELYPIIRAMLLEKVVILTLEHIGVANLVQQLLILIRKWVQLAHAKTFVPPTFGALKYVKKQKLRISMLEVIGVLLLCNDDPTIRITSIDTFKAISELASVSTNSQNREFIQWDDQICIYDIITKSETFIIESTISSKVYSVTSSPFKDMISLLSSDATDFISKFLNKFAQNITEHLPSTSTLSMIELGFRIQEIVSDPKFSQSTNLIYQWTNYCEFICGLVVRNPFSPEDFMKNRNKQFQSSKDIYNLIIPFLKEMTFVSQTVEILGDTNPAMLEILFEQLRPIESEGFNQSKNIQRKMKKRKDVLKIQVARVYSRISENVDISIFESNQAVINRYVDFIKEIFEYLSQRDNMYNPELHPLRFHLFAVLEHVIRKHFITSSTIPLEISKSLFYKILIYVIKWTGFGKWEAKRALEERRFIESQKEKSKDEASRKKIEAHFEQLSEVLKLKSLSSMSSLMLLFRITHKDISVLEQWNKYNRKAKLNASSETYTNITPNKDSEISQELTQSSILKIGVASTVYKKLSILGNHLPSEGSSNDKVAESEFSKEEIDQLFFEWIEEVLLVSKPHIHRVCVEIICNILLNNPHFISFYIDQCFNLNSRISEGYFHAICTSLKSIDIGLCAKESKTLLPALVTLILFMLVSQNIQIRIGAIELLQLTCDFFFEEHSKGDNFALMISSNVQDANEMLQSKISRKLSSNHPELSISVMKEIYSRIPYIPQYGQAMLLKSLVPWMTCILLEEKVQHGRADEKKQNYYRNSQKSLERLFEITRVYGSIFSSECEELWSAIAERSGHIPIIISFLVSRLSQFDIKSSRHHVIFTVAKQIILYLLASDEKETVSALIEKMELQYIADRSYMFHSSEPTTLLEHEIILILLVEIAYHSTAIGRHLAVLTQHCFMQIDHDLPLISESCKQLLANLLHQFVIRRLPHNGGTPAQMEQLQKARLLIDQTLRHKPKINKLKYFSNFQISDTKKQIDYSTERIRHRVVSEFPSLLGDISESYQEMKELLLGVLDIFGDQKELEEKWGRESILWATHSHNSLNMITRSFQIFRCLLPEVNYLHLQLILQTLFGYLESYIDTNNISILEVILEIIESLRELILSVDKHKLVLFTQLFWLAVALLRSDVIELYISGICLLGDILSSFDMGSASVQNVILSTQPKNFEGIQPLLQKGLLNLKSKPLIIQLLSKLTLLNCDSRILFQNASLYNSDEFFEKGRIFQLILLLVPHLCVQLQLYKEATNDSRDLAAQLALACDKQKLKKIARVFVRYSNGDYAHEDKFLLELRKPISDIFFPNYENMVYETMETLLESQEIEFQEAVLSFLHSWILHVDLRYSILYKQSRLIYIVTSFINQRALHEKAVKVLDVAVRISCKDSQGELTLLSKSHDAPVTLKSIPSIAQSPIQHKSYFNPAPGSATKTETLSILVGLFENSDTRNLSNDYLRLIIDHHTGYVPPQEIISQANRHCNSNSDCSDVTDSTETDVDYHTMATSFKQTFDEGMQKKIGLFDDLLKYEIGKMRFDEK